MPWADDEAGKLAKSLHDLDLHFNKTLEKISDGDRVFVNGNGNWGFMTIDYFHGGHGWSAVAQMADESDVMIHEMHSTKPHGRLWKAVAKIQCIWRIRRTIRRLRLTLGALTEILRGEVGNPLKRKWRVACHPARRRLS